MNKWFNGVTPRYPLTTPLHAFCIYPIYSLAMTSNLKRENYFNCEIERNNVNKNATCVIENYKQI